MKKLLQFSVLVLALLSINATNAQSNRLSTTVSTKCLSATVKAYGTLLDDSCAAITWYVNGSTTAAAKGNYATIYFSANGTYKICAKLLNTCKKFDTVICTSVTVANCDCNLTTDFKWQNDCKKVKFIASSNKTSGVTYTWTFGDNTEGKGGDPTHAYMSEGIYKVCVKATWTDSTGRVCTSTICKEIKVACGRPCELKGDFNAKQSGGKVRFKASSNSGYTYEWDFGDGKTGKGIDPYHEYAKAGTYTVCLKITDKTGKCFIKICKTIVVSSPCNLIGSFSWKKTTDSTYKFIATSNGASGTTYTWSWGDGTSSSGRDAAHVYKKSGVYEVCVKIYNPTSKCYTVICKKVEISVPSPSPCNWSKAGYGFGNVCRKYTFEAFNLANGCLKYQFVLKDSSGAVKYLTAGRLATYEFPATGTYYVKLYIKDTCKNCDTTIIGTVKVDCTPCKAVARFTVDSVSAYGKMYIKNTSTGAQKYSWNFGDSTATNNDKTPLHQFAKSGVYVVCLTATDTLNKCSTVYCYTVKVLRTRSKETINGGSNSASLYPNLYPNPADAGFYLNLMENNANYVVYGQNGQLITKGNGNGSVYLETQNWSEGLYKIEIRNGDTVKTQTVIVSH